MLKPCPFCHGQAEISFIDIGIPESTDNLRLYTAHCTKCGAEALGHSAYPSKENEARRIVAARWNQRYAE